MATPARSVCQKPFVDGKQLDRIQLAPMDSKLTCVITGTYVKEPL